MIKKRIVITGIVASVSAALVLGFLLLPQLSEGQPLSEPAPETDPVMRFGLTYIKVTPMLSAYYDLGVDSGVLVTEVIPGSPMELASVQPGDVILSCNGLKLDEGVPLLEMVRACRPSDNLVLEIYRDRCCRTVECCLYCGTPNCNCCGPTLNGK